MKRTLIVDTEANLPEKAKWRRHVGLVHRLRPTLALAMPRFPFTVVFGKAARHIGWGAYGNPALGTALFTWVFFVPTLVAPWFFGGWLAMALICTFWYVPRKAEAAPPCRAAVMIFFVMWQAFAWHKLGTFPAMIFAWQLFAAALVEAVLGFSSDHWVLRRRAAAWRRRFPMIYAIQAGKTRRIQGAVGGGEGAGSPFDNADGGRLEIDHPAMDHIPDLNVDAGTATWRIFAPNGRDMDALQENLQVLGSQDMYVSDMQLVVENPMATYGALVVTFHRRSDGGLRLPPWLRRGKGGDNDVIEVDLDNTTEYPEPQLTSTGPPPPTWQKSDPTLKYEPR